METEQPDSINPFAAPTADIAYSPATADMDPDEAIRRRYLNHEQSVKSIGVMFILGGLLSVFVLFGLGFGGLRGGMGITEIAILSVFVAVGGAQLVVGWNVRKLSRWTRIPAAILSAIWLLNVPIGTVVGLYFLYLLLSPKGKFVYSTEYQRIIAATPHVKYKTPLFVWIILFVLLGILAIAIGGVFFARDM